jgi:CheY-like chemotaxis protein/HPt (histidine-containing phosphotransfer) domain-containing protein
MTKLRIMHVDDEPDIREVVEISLGLDPGLATRSCSSGEEALVAAVDWQPDIILCDVMMPVMDGPATLMRLRENALTAGIPVIFMTARAQTRELDRFRSLGALGVIPKPFDPMTLAASVRGYVQSARDPLDDLRAGFLLRVRKDVVSLSEQRLLLRDGNRPADVLDLIKRTAHGLSGAGGIYGFAELSDAAAALEDAVIAELSNPGPRGDETDLALDGLISCAGNSGGQIA